MDGCDMCGKTHIAHLLGERLGINVFKASSEHDTFLSRQDRFINDLRFADPRTIDLLNQLRFSAIFDRSYISEWVYSRFFNRPTDEKMLNYVDAGFQNLNARIIWCDRHSFVGITDDLDPRIDSVALTRLQGLYADAMKWSKVKHLHLFVDDEDIEREFLEIHDWLDEEGVI